MTRTEARKIARQMLRSGGFKVVEIVEDLTHDEIRIVAQNRCWNTRTVRTPDDWDDLQREIAR